MQCQQEVRFVFTEKEAANCCPSLAVNQHQEGDLNFVAWMDEMTFVHSPEGPIELDHLFVLKEMLLFALVHNILILEQGISSLLIGFPPACARNAAA